MPYKENFTDNDYTSYEKLNSFIELSNSSTTITHELIVEFFNDLYDYLDNININDNFYIITFLYNKLKENNESFITNINELIYNNIITNYFSIIINYYEKMPE